jgi:hypothetical protein
VDDDVADRGQHGTARKLRLHCVHRVVEGRVI